MGYLLTVFRSAVSFFARNISSIVLLIEWLIATLTIAHATLKKRETIIDVGDAIIVDRETT
jgi:hypothetical protein